MSKISDVSDVWLPKSFHFPFSCLRGCHSQLQVGLRLWLSLMTWSDELDEHDEQDAQNDGLADFQYESLMSLH